MVNNEKGKTSMLESEPEIEFERKHLNDLVMAQAAFERAQGSSAHKKSCRMVRNHDWYDPPGRRTRSVG